jgi:hypothetical protein
METIHRTLNNVPLPDVRACRHLAEYQSCDVHAHPVCANCAGYLCVSCEDDAVHCSGSTCIGVICLECQTTARKRTVPFFSDWRQRLSGENPQRTEYLCATCCTKQDAAKLKLEDEIDDTVTSPYVSFRFSPDTWLDEIVDRLETAVEKAKEAL